MKAKRIAAYRYHYGSDFLLHSIESIIDHIDMVYIHYTDVPWSLSDTHNFKISYKGAMIDHPKNPDPFSGVIDKITEHFGDRVELVFETTDRFDKTPANQFGKIMLDLISRFNAKHVLCIEPDMVFDPTLVVRVFEQVHELDHLSLLQTELWKTNKWRIPTRNRVGPTLYNFDVAKHMPLTHFGTSPIPPPGHPTYIFSNDALVYNFGFCVRDVVMEYKHMCALGFSLKIGDSVPSETWLDDKWRNWTPNTRDIEIAKNYTSSIERAIPFTMPRHMVEFMNRKY